MYESTRGSFKNISSAEAVKMGIAPDGGLFVPDAIPEIADEVMSRIVDMDYLERAVSILKPYLLDYSEEEIIECVNNAYSLTRFDTSEIAPVRKLDDSAYILELWHGPTCAFKDMALQLLPHLLVKAAVKTGETKEIVILVATSGDTGKAALEGFRDVKGTKIIVFYPYKGVSEIQEMQMVTQEGSNVFPIAVEGNFDDAQSGVKSIFTDSMLINAIDEKGYRFSSANSINWGRLVPQIVYYFSAYGDMVKNNWIKPGEMVNIAVPTGNFGNILAAFYSMKMGLPVKKLICASNENNVLTDFINTGVYNRNREFKKTMSPSMDILISSNLERLLYEITEHDSFRIINWMKDLSDCGIYEVDNETKSRIGNLFWAGYSSEEETLNTIKAVYDKYGYLVDTHTAVALNVYKKYTANKADNVKTIIASTASPFKFNESVSRAILGSNKIKGKSEFELLGILSKESGMPVPGGLRGLDKKEIKHNRVCMKNEMKLQVEKILGI
ncbi:MAG TPA: threonine synthase [Clostridiales bacterium]|nr:threonine synthase [Clostridiales bacterium]